MGFSSVEGSVTLDLEVLFCQSSISMERILLLPLSVMEIVINWRLTRWLHLLIGYSGYVIWIFQVRGFDVEFLCCLLISPSAPDCALQALLGHTDTVTCLTASLAYHIIVSGSRDRTCIIWDLNKLSFLTQLRGHRAPISALCINELTVRAKPCPPGCSGNSSKSWKSLNQRENKH